MSLGPALRALIVEEQARDGRFVEGVDLDVYLDKLGAHAEILADTRGHRCLGFVAFYANDLVSKQAFITLVLVAPEARGGGLGRALVEGALAICRARGFETCRLEVRHDNAPALAVYRGLGFVSVGDAGGKHTLEIRL